MGKGIATVAIWVSPFAFHLQGTDLSSAKIFIPLFIWGIIMALVTSVIWASK